MKYLILFILLSCNTVHDKAEKKRQIANDRDQKSPYYLKCEHIGGNINAYKRCENIEVICYGNKYSQDFSCISKKL